MTGRDRMVIIIVAAIVAVAGVWMLVIQPKRDEASKLDGQVATAQQQLSAARAQIAIAQGDQKTYARNYANVASLGEAVPTDDQTPSLIYQLQNAATHAGVDFRSLVLNPAGSSTAAPAPATSSGGKAPSTTKASGTPASGTPSSGTPGSAVTNASTSQAVTATLPPGAGVGPAGLPTLPFTFTFQGNFFHMANFFGRLERFVVATNNNVSVSGRLMTLNAISLGAGPKGFPEITATISATTYLVPASQGATGGATVAGPAASGAQPASSSTGAAPAIAAATPPTP